MYDMTPEIPPIVKRYATLEAKHDDYDHWMPAFEGLYRELEKYLAENEYEMIKRDEENDRKFHIRDLAKNRVGTIEYWEATKGKGWEFWMVFKEGNN